MASIRLLSSGKYNVQVRIAGQKPISKTFNSHAEAKAFARACLNNCRHGPPTI